MSRIVFFGSPQEAVFALRSLVEANHQMAAVYTRPDSIAGRSKVPEPTPVKAAALQLGIPVESPATLRAPAEQERLASYGADVFAVAAYGRILPPAALRLPRLGALNIHPSFLPRHRGPSPVATAILDGDPHTGVTVMLLDEGMDTGPLLAQSEPVPIGARDTTGGLTARLFEMGARLLVDTLEKWERGTISPRPQDRSKATVTRLLERGDGLIDWSNPADLIERMTRAYDPWPGTFTRWGGRTLKLLEIATSEAGGEVVQPGAVFTRGADMVIACGHGAIVVKRLQIEGRRAVMAAEFMRGYPSIEGAQLRSD
ncbi:MAG: methionyl-tRNA formyltransferase [Chloroflexi bacterium]|nr:methionyl-tRNA formyltransferase [Chloroflexota bacterium]